MDPRVVKQHGGDLRKANIYPPARERLMRKYPVPAELLKAERSADVASEPVSKLAPVATASRHQCPNCGYIYDEAVGCPHEGVALGTRWSSLPMTWPCPQCAVREKQDFVALA